MTQQKKQHPVIAWIDHRLPIFSAIDHTLNDYPTPKNLNYFWNFGSLAGIMLVIMIVTGIVLAMHYTADTKLAFQSVERIMRDVNGGWLIRYLHANGASMFFIVVYIHIFRGLYYGSYKSPRELLWALGVVIFLLMMATAFMGYVLPWGQMSFWGATVITNLFSAIPLIGEDLVVWLWGGFSVDNPTLTRFFALHYLMPFVIFGVVILHIVALHQHGSNNPLGIDLKEKKDTIPFHPYYTIKDFFGFGVFFLMYAGFVFFAPNYLGHPDNYTPANPLVTPPHIVPEWYFLPFYAILRAVTFHIHLVYLGLVLAYVALWVITRNAVVALAPVLALGVGFAVLMAILKGLGLEGLHGMLASLSVDAKLGGVIAMFGAVLILFILPVLDRHPVRSSTFRPWYRPLFWIFGVNAVLLGFCGAKPTTEMIHIGFYLFGADLTLFKLPVLQTAQFTTFWYFFHFLVLMPLLSQFEPQKPLPKSIGDAVLPQAPLLSGSMHASGAVHKETH
jgi:quinol-cytochrome oxidoreductase complex cytochrome b subunit